MATTMHELHMLKIPADLYECIVRRAQKVGQDADQYALASLYADFSDWDGVTPTEETDWQEPLRQAQEYVIRLRGEISLTDEEIEADIDAAIRRYRTERGATLPTE